jgi:hypothetical protein
VFGEINLDVGRDSANLVAGIEDPAGADAVKP